MKWHALHWNISSISYEVWKQRIIPDGERNNTCVYVYGYEMMNYSLLLSEGPEHIMRKNGMIHILWKQ